MSTKLSISIDDELAKLIKAEAKRTGRSVSEVFADAIRAYRKYKRRESYARFAKSNVSSQLLKEFEDIQLETLKGL